MNLPAGVWTIASDWANLEQAEAWIKKTSAADAWTFRNPQVSEREALGLLRRMRGKAPWLAVHGRSDWANLVQADALIGGHGSLPWEELAQRKTSGQALGFSVHNDAEWQRAKDCRADFILFSPVYPTPSKEEILEVQGLEALAKVCARGIPVIALGGILTPTEAQPCMDAGAHAVAVLRAAGELIL